jgi:hypothetical protein
VARKGWRIQISTYVVIKTTYKEISSLSPSPDEFLNKIKQDSTEMQRKPRSQRGTFSYKRVPYFD